MAHAGWPFRALSTKHLVVLTLATLFAGGLLGAAPVSAAPLVSGPSLGTGEFHTCFLDAAGAATCYGLNDRGQAPPGGVAGPFTALTAGSYHNCALTPAGDAFCWGDNADGQAPPEGVTGPFAKIAAGIDHTCALSALGAVTCWGDNSADQAPEEVAGPFTDLDAGWGHTCALTSTGAATCWGGNLYGQAPPEGMAGPFTSVTANFNHACALTSTGAATCWGNNQYGQAPPGGLAGPFTALSAGYFHTCGLTPAGEAICTGNQDVPAAGPFVELSAGLNFSCGLTATGELRCWGENYYGQAPQDEQAAKEVTATTVTCPAEATYSGSALQPCTARVTGLGLNETLVVEYRNNVKAGTATASAAFAGNEDFRGSDDSTTFIILAPQSGPDPTGSGPSGSSGTVVSDIGVNPPPDDARAGDGGRLRVAATSENKALLPLTGLGIAGLAMVGAATLGLGFLLASRNGLSAMNSLRKRLQL